VCGTIVFTDLDGTLLDYDGYTWAAAGAAVRELLRCGGSIVFCSSKTLAEQRVYRRDLGIRDPMIVEDGSAVVIPRGYFPERIDLGMEPWGRAGSCDLLVLGVGRHLVLERLRELRETEGIALRGYSDMTLQEVRDMTGLDEAAAGRARTRDFSETVHVEGGTQEWRRLMGALEMRGLHTFGCGPTGTVVGLGADKGRAVELLTDLYRQAALEPGVGRTGPLTVGIGDAANDVPMLRAVDRAFLVERPGGGWVDVEVRDLERVEGVGPVGWSRAVTGLLAAQGLLP
jgi:mannosyl-3-phosphoglycerate phosphatase